MNIPGGEVTRVDLEEVAQGPGPYTMSYGFNLDILCSSIRKAGLISPPLLARNEKGCFDVVTGYRRVLALRSLGESGVSCREVTSVLPTPFDRLLASFYENLATRQFNDIEKAMILQRLQTYVSREEIVASFLSLLSLPCRKSTLTLYSKLTNLDEKLQQAIADQHISMRTVKALFECDEACPRVLFESLSAFGFNFNQQIQFIDYAKDISIREGIPILQVLSDESIGKTLNHPRWNKPQKAKAVLEILRSRRFPRLARAQRVVQSRISSVSLPPNAAIHYDPCLEAPHYRLEIRFKNGKDLRESINRLHSSAQLESIPDPWQKDES